MEPIYLQKTNMCTLISEVSLYLFRIFFDIFSTIQISRFNLGSVLLLWSGWLRSCSPDHAWNLFYSSSVSDFSLVFFLLSMFSVVPTIMTKILHPLRNDSSKVIKGDGDVFRLERDASVFCRCGVKLLGTPNFRKHFAAAGNSDMKYKWTAAQWRETYYFTKACLSYFSETRTTDR